MIATKLPAGWKSIGDAQIVLNSDQQIVLNCGDSQLQVSPLANDLVRIRVTPTSGSQDLGSWAVAKERWDLPKHGFSDDGRNVTIDLKDFKIRISKSPVRVTFLTPEGDIINQDDSSKGMGWDGSEVRVWKTMPENELYYGFGEKTGMLDRRGLAMTDWNSDIPAYTPGTDPLYQSIPFFLGMQNGKFYGIFFDNTFRSSFDMGKESQRYYSFGAEGGTIDYYFFYGPSPKKVLERFTELTGRMNLPPKWALGYQQCRWSYSPEAKVRDIAENFRKRNIPCDVIYLDIDYMDGYRCFTWSKENFPNPQKMVSDLAHDGFKIVTIIDPGIKKDSTYWVYQEGARGNHFVRKADSAVFIGPVWPGDCAFPDFANTDARIWWGGLYKDLVKTGIKGFWNDMNEPSVFDVPSKTFPLDARHNVDGEVETHAEIHNVYGMEMARGTYEGLLKLQPNERPFVLTRAGYAGTQRYSAAWTGDNVSSWEHLAMAMPMCMNFGLSGQPFVGPDIGGFIGTPTGEMYTRWLEYGVFLPLCRSHSVKGSINKEPWAFGENFEAINRKFIELRYRLLPYLYTEFYKASVTGVPIMRPLMLEFPEDKTTYRIDTQFMVGGDILVSPVVEAGSTTRRMYLPAGNWYDFWTREKIAGGKWIEAAAPIDRIPIFVRAGSVIPMQQVVQYSDQAPADPLTFEIFPSDTAHGLCYEDDGISFDYRKGMYRSVDVDVKIEGNVISLERSKAKGTFTPAARSVVFAINGVTRRPGSISIRGVSISEAKTLEEVKEGWIFDASQKCLSIKTMDTPDAFSVSIK
ncbi:MAG TPA: glycoside hydrolase family 31 protein [Bacteroidota bacterium]|nr:glycoside hydrolase family 31 protein [Bacteroidota bacterium]